MIPNSFEIRPIAGALGAEIAGIDLTEKLDSETISAIRRAWLDHLVIFFREQHLTPERFLAFARRFGEIPNILSSKGSTDFGDHPGRQARRRLPRPSPHHAPGNPGRR
jgi:taurine dioxygenase